MRRMTFSLICAAACVLCVAPVAGGVLPAWEAIGDDASANAVITRREGQPPVRYADLKRRGSVELPVAGPERRVQWDFKVPFDFTKTELFSFDLRVDDLSGITEAAVYLKSGNGWYRMELSVNEEGVWQRIRWPRARKVGIEGKPIGYHRIDAVRIAFGRSAARKTTTAAVADFAVAEERDARVLLLQGAYSAKKMPAEADSLRLFAGSIGKSLDRVGVPYTSKDDDGVTADAFAGKTIAILPYNPALPPETVAAIKAFIAKGGKVFSLYTLPKGVGELLGIANRGFRRATERGEPVFTGLLRTGKGLAGQPDFAAQRSNNANEPTLTGPGEIVAVWGGREEKSLGIPALVSTPAGVYMGHVWQPDAAGARDGLLKAVIGTLDPSFKEEFARAEEEARIQTAKRRAFVRSVPGKAGERRLVWCHGARGIGGGWDESIRLLAENGFTDIIANLTWADCAFYDSSVTPVAASVATKGDAFEQCKAACRKYGVGFHVWRVCYNMGGHTDAARVAKYKAEGRLVQAFDAKAKNPWATTFCPSHPENRKREIEAMVELARKGVDGIHFDYIRYADGNFCFCDGCRRRFEAHLGRAVTDWPADVRKDAALAKAWTAWRAETISSVVAETACRVRAEFPKVEISVAARADRDSAYSADGQDWVRWAKEGWVDILCPMDYTDATPFFRNIYRSQRALLAGTNVKLYPGIGVSCWKKDGAETQKMARHIQALRQDGLDGFTVFALDGNSNVTFPQLREGPLREVPRAGERELKISVFPHFITKTAKERGITYEVAARMLYDLGVRGFDCAVFDKELDQLAATRLKPINLYYFPTFKGADRGAAENARALDIAARHGVPRIMTLPPSFTKDGDEEAEFKRLSADMKAFVAQAKARGITITTEDFGNVQNACSHLKYLKRLLDEIPDLRFALDSGNLYYAGRGESVIELMDYAKGRIAHVHLKDQLPENNRKYATLGRGAVPNEKIVKTTWADGYEGWYTLENPVGDTYTDTVRQVAVLKAWLKQR